MQIVTDMQVIDKGQRAGRIASFAGLGVLVVGLVVSFLQRDSLQQFSVILVYACLLVGFILSNVGIYLANRWVRGPRADEILEKVLKGLDDRFHVYNYCLPASHVVVTPVGLIVLILKRQTGTISCNGDRWRHKLTFGRIVRFLTEEGVGNPSKEAVYDVALMERYLKKEVPEEAIPVASLIVFTGDREKLSLTVENPSTPVVQVSQLKEQVRELGRGRPLPSAVTRGLVRALDEAAGVE